MQRFSSRNCHDFSSKKFTLILAEFASKGASDSDGILFNIFRREKMRENASYHHYYKTWFGPSKMAQLLVSSDPGVARAPASWIKYMIWSNGVLCTVGLSVGGGKYNQFCKIITADPRWLLCSSWSGKNSCSAVGYFDFLHGLMRSFLKKSGRWWRQLPSPSEKKLQTRNVGTTAASRVGMLWIFHARVT